MRGLCFLVHLRDRQQETGIIRPLGLYIFIYGSTWLTTCWVQPTEIFPLASRSKGHALATIAFSIAGWTINEIIPYLINAIGFWKPQIGLLSTSIFSFRATVPSAGELNRNLWENSKYRIQRQRKRKWRHERSMRTMEVCVDI
ncbi:hypothetical protein V1505DRAFT_172692 [Lipomyces doorenjongii]